MIRVEEHRPAEVLTSDTAHMPRRSIGTKRRQDKGQCGKYFNPATNGSSERFKPMAAVGSEARSSGSHSLTPTPRAVLHCARSVGHNTRFSVGCWAWKDRLSAGWYLCCSERREEGAENGEVKRKTIHVGTYEWRALRFAS